MIIATIALAAAQPIALSGMVPVLCVDSKGEPQPIRNSVTGEMRNTSFATFKAAFRRQFKFTGSVFPTGPENGRLVFRSGVKGAETITYDVRPSDQGLMLTAMHVRLRGKRDDLTGNDMCWQTFSIINAR